MFGSKRDADRGFLTFGTELLVGESADDLAHRIARRITTGAVVADESVERRPLGHPRSE
jgi:hypothetical protein